MSESGILNLLTLRQNTTGLMCKGRKGDEAYELGRSLH